MLVFNSSSGLERITRRLLRKLFGKVVNTAFYLSSGKFWLRRFFFRDVQSFTVFGHWAKKMFAISPPKILQWCQSCSLRVRGTVWGNFFELFSTFSFVWDFWRRVFISLAKLFSSVVKTAFYVPRTTFWWNLYFLKFFDFLIFPDIQKIVFGLVTKVFWHGCQIRLLRVQKEKLWKNNVHQFRSWPKNFREFERKNYLKCCLNCILSL